MFGLFGGDMGEGIGEFRHVEFRDIMAEMIGETLADVRQEVSL